MSEFPKNIDEVINSIGKEYKIEVKRTTHYDTLNRVLEWTETNTKKNRFNLHRKVCYSHILQRQVSFLAEIVNMVP